jgi:hypothetical protein
VKLVTLNVQAGADITYCGDASRPVALRLLQNYLRAEAPDIAVLTDTFRWRGIFTDDDLLRLFNATQVVCIDTDDIAMPGDDRVLVDPRIGITILTFTQTCVIESSQAVRCYNRNFIRCVMRFEGQYVQLYGVYADHLSESVRYRQMQCLHNDAAKNPDLPVILAGDFNSLPVAAVPAFIRRAGNFLALPFMRGFSNYLFARIKDLASPSALPYLEESYDLPTPTLLTYRWCGIRLLPVDFIMTAGLKPPGIALSNFPVHFTDHSPLVATF